ncbi:hypothetical protein L0222_16710 [bacterium]|nr:hypothetical protein [bacterium]MCI0605230.1 hypothetical protein [bacterium]
MSSIGGGIGIGRLVNLATAGAVSDALGDVSEGINTRGSVGIAEAENAFQNFSQQEIAGFSPMKPLVVNDSAFYPSPTEAYKTMLKGNDPNTFSSIVDPLEVNRFMNDPNFKSADALASCSNNLLGGKGVTDNLLGQDGLLSSMLGGVQLKLDQEPDQIPDSLSKMDSFEGLLNLNPNSAEGKGTLKLFREQLRALNGFEGVVKEQVALDQQLQNFQNFQGGKFFR